MPFVASIAGAEFSTSTALLNPRKRRRASGSGGGRGGGDLDEDDSEADSDEPGNVKDLQSQIKAMRKHQQDTDERLKMLEHQVTRLSAGLQIAADATKRMEDGG